MAQMTPYEVARLITAGLALDFVHSGQVKAERFYRAEDFCTDDPVLLPEGRAVKVSFEYADDMDDTETREVYAVDEITAVDVERLR